MSFSQSTYEGRVKSLQRLMDERGIDALAILDIENYHYFTGDFRKQPRLYIPKLGEPLLIVFKGEEEEVSKSSWIKRIKTYTNMHEMMVSVIEWIKENEIKTIGFNFDFSLPAFLIERFKLANPSVKVMDATELCMELRMVKLNQELELIKKAAEIAINGMEAVREILKEGMKEYEVVGEIEYAMRKKGAERFAFPTFVNSGYRSNWLHGIATRKEIKKEELILIDIGPVYRGYCADMTRMFIIGSPNDEQKKLLETYIKIRNAAVDVARPGKRIMDLDNAAQKALGGTDYSQHYVRGIAHGIGLAFEEKPFPTIFPEDSVIELKPNMTISIGHSILSIPKIAGARVEDVFLITDEGAKKFVEYPEHLISV
ncbi:MAG: Xaa-Pro peptidase family protein [Candidatus Bathyarchaeia archaeon]